ncbi:hypothetical protein GURASL_01300 [Geotalea uraniireducens]|uniref:Uncharacterized protein n=1 Tax=Geotalea uraniireducens TaxID=351604 RepID=A0ABM8EG23_9BACT|nr:hypothetical protein GURASL_01300 [Geotalea uraniireducens]
MKAGMIVFTLCRRNTVCILKTVLISEDAQINVAPFYLFQINRIGTLVSCRKFLKQKNIRNKTAQNCISQKKRL